MTIPVNRGIAGTEKGECKEMHDKYLPIIIGAYDEGDKMSLWGRHRIFRNGRDLFIVRLKKRMKRGEDIPDFDPMRDVESVCCHIHFCKREALEVFARSVNQALEGWDEDEL